MPRPGITYQDVKKAAETLVKSNKNVTAERIREQLKTGSNTTITKHLQTWREYQAHAYKDPHLPQELIKGIKTLWEQMRDINQADMQQSQEKNNAIVQDLKEQILSLESQNHELTKQRSQLEEQGQEKNDMLTQQRSQIDQQRLQETKLNEQLQQKQYLLDQLRLEQDKLHGHIKQTQKSFEHYQERMQQQLEHHRSEMDALRNTSAQAQKQLELALSQGKLRSQQLSDQLDQTKQQLSIAQTQQATLDQQNRQLEITINQQKILLDTTNKQLIELKEQLNTIKTKADSYYQLHIQTREYLISTKANENILKESLKKSQDQIRKLNEANKTLSENTLTLSEKLSSLVEKRGQKY